MQLKVLTSIDDGRRVWNFGELMPISDQAEADRLIRLGAAELFVERRTATRVVSSLSMQPAEHVGTSICPPPAEVVVGSLTPKIPDEDEVLQSDIDALISKEMEAAGVEIAPVIEALPNNGVPVVYDVNLFSSLGINDDIAAILVNRGFDTMDKLRAASLEQLVALPKIGYARARKIVNTLSKG